MEAVAEKSLVESLDDLYASVPDVVTVDESDSDLVTVTHDKEACQKWLDAKKTLADAEASEKALNAALKLAGEPLRMKEAQRSQGLVKSVILDGMVRYTRSQKFSAVKVGLADSLSKLFGPSFGTYFLDAKTPKYDEKVAAAKFREPEVAAAIRSLIKHGVIKVERSLKPTELLYRDFTFNDQVHAKCVEVGIEPQAVLAKGK